jgi:hypothetical protein
VGGSELTTYYGHALALGVRQWQEWRVGINNITDINAITGINKITMPDIALQVKGKGGVFIIAHPKSVGDPDCTGCDWHYSDMMPGVARHIEVWNGPWSGDSGAGDSSNQKALELWYSWLNQGYRMVATAGTDIHGPMSDPNPGFNTVYANDLTELAILGAIKRGHLYLSSGPKLELSASNQQERVMMGDLITGDNLMLSLKWHDCLSNDVLKIIIDGVVVNLYQLSESGSLEWPLPHQGRWCTVEVRGKNGHMRVLTNPIFTAPTSQ